MTRSVHLPPRDGGARTPATLSPKLAYSNVEPFTEQSAVLSPSQKLAHSIPEACEILSLGRTRVYGEIKNGKLKSFKSGSRTLVSRTAIEAYIAAREAEFSVPEEVAR